MSLVPLRVRSRHHGFATDVLQARQGGPRRTTSRYNGHKNSSTGQDRAANPGELDAGGRPQRQLCGHPGGEDAPQVGTAAQGGAGAG